jgi:hypothetical protein
MKHKKRKHDNPARLREALALVPNRPGTPWREILGTCCETLGTTPGDLRRYDSRPPTTDYRHIATVELYRAGYVTREVGAILYRDNSTVWASRKRYEELCEVDATFRALAQATSAAVQSLLIAEPVQI